MAFDPKGILQQVQTFLAASNRFDAGTSIGEPKAPPGQGLYAAVMLGPISITDTTLKYAQGRIDLIVRLYRNAMNEPLEETEFLMGQAIFELIEDFCGDFDFGDANVRNLRPVDLTAAPGYQMIGQTMFRVADITIPLQVNDIAVLSA